MSLDDRMFWAALAAVVGTLHDGPELGTGRRLFQRLEAACRSFGVPAADFDQVAELLDYHYVRYGDYYTGKEGLAEMARIDAILAAERVTCGTLH
jgi:hypothetical protein